LEITKARKITNEKDQIESILDQFDRDSETLLYVTNSSQQVPTLRSPPHCPYSGNHPLFRKGTLRMMRLGEDWMDLVRSQTRNVNAELEVLISRAWHGDIFEESDVQTVRLIQVRSLMRNQPARQALIGALDRRITLGKVSVQAAGFRNVGLVAKNALEVAWEESDFDTISELITQSKRISCEETKETLRVVIRESALMRKRKLWRGVLQRLTGSAEELAAALSTLVAFNCPPTKAQELISEAAAARNITIEALYQPQQAAPLLPADPLGVL
jgi:hypothetical protein